VKGGAAGGVQRHIDKAILEATTGVLTTVSDIKNENVV
jgi:hypothetical protein